jgi:hypothetical protein
MKIDILKEQIINYYFFFIKMKRELCAEMKIFKINLHDIVKYKKIHRNNNISNVQQLTEKVYKLLFFIKKINLRKN